MLKASLSLALLTHVWHFYVIDLRIDAIFYCARNENFFNTHKNVTSCVVNYTKGEENISNIFIITMKKQQQQALDIQCAVVHSIVVTNKWGTPYITRIYINGNKSIKIFITLLEWG